jgi:hypothetical protein
MRKEIRKRHVEVKSNNKFYIPVPIKGSYFKKYKRTTLKCISDKSELRGRTGLIWLSIGAITSSCENGY